MSIERPVSVLLLISISSIIIYCLISTQITEYVDQYVLLPSIDESTNGYKSFPDTFTHFHKCHDDIDTVIVVKSVATNFEYRRIIRTTFGNGEDQHFLRFQIFFAIENVTNEEENVRYRDILQVADEKLVIQWFLKNCHHAKYLILSDDDIYINVYNLFDETDRLKNESLKNNGKFLYQMKWMANKTSTLMSIDSAKDLILQGLKNGHGKGMMDMKSVNINLLIEKLAKDPEYNSSELSVDIRRTLFVGHSLNESDMNIIHNYVKRFEFATVRKVCLELIAEREFAKELTDEKKKSEDDDDEEEEEDGDDEEEEE